MAGDCTIKLQKGAQPSVAFTPRHVPIPLLPAVKAELQWMQDLGVRVTEPTEWCVGMVVVPKPNGQVRICVDPSRLNESVCRERRQLIRYLLHWLVQKCSRG